ncbi:MAG: hypothetical protein WCK09_00230 [Bacteroidota bacterium]
MINKKTLKKLYDKLPLGSAQVILERIIKKNPDLHFTLRYVQAVLNPEDKRYNTIIIEEAIQYLEDYNDRNDDLEKRIIQS